MKPFKVDSSYRQFYVADAELEPEAPEEWTDAHVDQRHNTQQHIAALCPAGDVSASIVSIGPGEDRPSFDEPIGFEVETKIEVPSGRVGEWESTAGLGNYGMSIKSNRVRFSYDLWVMRSIKWTRGKIFIWCRSA